jgi:hypothetical protein
MKSLIINLLKVKRCDMRIIFLIVFATLLYAQDSEPGAMSFDYGSTYGPLQFHEQSRFLTGFEYSGEINFDTTLMNNSNTIQPHSPAVILQLGNGVENKFVSNT